jgi:uroporphyrinogen-III synthase
VLTIRPLHPPEFAATIARLAEFDAVVFLSQHAVAFGMPQIAVVWPQLPPGLSWIAVGDATAAALATHGVVAAVPYAQNSEGILALFDTRGVAPRRVLIVAGSGGRIDLERGLRERGAIVERLELYRRESASLAAAEALVRQARGIDCVVIASADGARAFATLWQAAGGNFDVPMVVPSARVGHAAADLKFTNVVESAGAGIAAVIETTRTIVGTNDEQ